MASGLEVMNVVSAEMTARGPRPFPFRIVVPQGWKPIRVDDEPLSTDTPSAIVIFESPDEPMTTVQALGIVLENEIAAVHWLRYYLRKRGWASTDISSNGPRKARASITHVIDGLPMTGVLTATVNGNTLLLLQAFCPAQRFGVMKEVLNLGVRSLSIETPVAPNVIEPWTTVEVTSWLTFQFPASWAMRRPGGLPQGKAVVDWLRTDDRGTVQGTIRVKAVDRAQATTLQEAIVLVLREFEDSGLVVTDPISPRPVSPPPGWSQMAVVDVRGQTNAENVLHFQSYGLQGSDGIVVVACMGPDAGTDYYQWAVNFRAFEIALASLGN